jgi:hypothetical protein
MKKCGFLKNPVPASADYTDFYHEGEDRKVV